MTRAVDELWSVALDKPQVDADALAGAIEAAAEDEATMDYRTRLLVRDGVAALLSHWGDARMRSWLSDSPRREQIERICVLARTQAAEDGDDRGFQTLARRVVDAIKPDTVRQFLRELSAHVRKPTRLLVGGSIALILGGYLARRTDDVDVVDEVPEELRAQHAAIEDLARRFGLRLSHFQSHYLPTGWERRIHSFDTFASLQVFTIDVYDVLAGKLFSVRHKDRDDLRAILPKLDRDMLIRRVIDTTAPLRSEQRLLDAAKQNWYFLFGEELPS